MSQSEMETAARELIDRLTQRYAEGLRLILDFDPQDRANDQKRIFESCRDGLIQCGFTPLAAANLTRGIIHRAAAIVGVQSPFSESDLRQMQAIVEREVA